ncbi:aldo/keto reductase [Haloactinomyces albus]|uniref:Aryl-alcohol dehydrogenase-like predicted oxidoreductase n=1 Tax=Haloactinomyces albus TaxID=1352928 RepID=A0AAE3Z9Y4_9ACTN|nr:aldo/keto reductase [Haloactinomyces albus]MDR7299828.1 aryl-alcohol dehydrogenase-like predicted oxidoreductase [Haloactinomyces albus]
MAETAQVHPNGTDAPGRLGGRPVNRVGYGAMQLENAEREQAVSLLRRAVEWGVDHVDTAQFYGDGHVNELIRTALHPYPEHLVVVSKVGAVHDDGGQYGLAPAQRPEDLRASVEANLRSLGVERLDVVNLRRLDGGGPGIQASGDQLVDLDDQLAELVALRQEGKIDDIGLSNVTQDQLRHALPIGIACVQNCYNLLDRSGESVLDECRAHDIAWVPFFPLGSALPGMAKVTDHPAVTAAAERAGATPAQVGLAWLLAHAPQVLLIPGTTDPAHLEQNFDAADIQLSPETVAELDELGNE